MRQAIEWFTCWHCTLLIGSVYAVVVVCAGWRHLTMVNEMSQFSCPHCRTALGKRAVRAGSDVSPFEEIWGDDEGTRHWHCHPTCRKITCQHCSAEVVLRWNLQGTKCGPRIAVRPDDSEDPAA